MVSLRLWVVDPSTRWRNPFWKPMTSIPWLMMASMVTDEMTPLMPGAGPPPTRMPRRLPFRELAMLWVLGRGTGPGDGKERAAGRRRSAGPRVRDAATGYRD